MIRIVARGLAAVLLEIATAAVIAALVTLTLSAYLTARIVGVSPKLNRRAALVMRLARDGMAMAVNAKRSGDATNGDSD